VTVDSVTQYGKDTIFSFPGLMTPRSTTARRWFWMAR